MDQKVAPDVLQFIAECLLNYMENALVKTFTIKEIWDSDYFRKNVTKIFNKPSPDDKRTNAEYDKFVGQPIQTLSYAKILSAKGSRPATYEITNIDALRYIARAPQNAYDFLYQYLIKVLSDSGFYSNFEIYRDAYLTGKLTSAEFADLKKKFIRFMLGNTNINQEVEIRRIFPKVINILAAENRLPGTVKGKVTKYPFMLSDLTYNRTNSRDKNKFKGMTRREARIAAAQKRTAKDDDLSYRVAKAKAKIKMLHPTSEIKDQWSNGDATQVHHIFPENEFPRLADRLENLIRLTPTQHNTKAHPANKTQYIDRDYQCLCLIEKSFSIEESIKRGQFEYSKESFIGAVNTGLHLNLPYDLDFDSIRNEIKKAYRK